jgi:hypothetical protein
MLLSKAVNMTRTRHDFEHVAIVIRPMNAESLDSSREERVHLDPIEEVERPIPTVRVLAEVKVDSAKYATEGDVAMEGRDGEPRAEEVPRDEACDLVPDFRRDALRGGDTRKVDLTEGPRQEKVGVYGRSRRWGGGDERRAPGASRTGALCSKGRMSKPSGSLQVTVCEKVVRKEIEEKRNAVSRNTSPLGAM